MNTPLLRCRGLEAGYGASQVLFGLDFDIQPGEVVALLGRNGMGKSTTIRSIVGGLRPQRGEIVFDGRAIHAERADAIARLGVAIVPEGRQCFPNLTVQEHLVAFAARRNGVAEPWTPARLYALYPDMPEGKMSRLRAELVCEQALHGVALTLHLGDYIRLGHGEERSGGRERPSILADAVEAVIAAMYLDGGLEPAQRFILAHILNGLAEGEIHHVEDYKTELQERVQRRAGQTLSYTVCAESGPDHNKTFTMAVLLNGSEIGRGTGRTKKEAEQSAARCALEQMPQ